MKGRLRRWALRRLAVAELGELRRFNGTDWRLAEITWQRLLNGPSALTLRYELSAEHDLTAAEVATFQREIAWPGIYASGDSDDPG